MHGLSRHAESIADLFPGPSLLPGSLHCGRFDLLGQPMKRTDSPQGDRRVLRLEALRQIFRIHGVSAWTDSADVVNPD
ncbi:hypothetical protein [Amycolatopsis lexingtonensis]|uniref:hypothetical protein n=1 Tax=Amycolatopsis lexingtonensis TaxID=218822 RepID=UPI003F72BB44